MQPESLAYRCRRHGKQEPERRKHHAYLPEKVERLRRVIPYVPAEQQVHHTADQQLERGYDRAAVDAFCEHALIGVRREVAVHYQQARSARQGHAPVREPSEKYLYHRIDQSARQKYCQVFRKNAFSFHFCAAFHFFSQKYYVRNVQAKLAEIFLKKGVFFLFSCFFHKINTNKGYYIITPRKTGKYRGG